MKNKAAHAPITFEEIVICEVQFKKGRKEARGAQILAKHYFQPQVPN